MQMKDVNLDDPELKYLGLQHKLNLKQLVEECNRLPKGSPIYPTLVLKLMDVRANLARLNVCKRAIWSWVKHYDPRPDQPIHRPESVQTIFQVLERETDRLILSMEASLEDEEARLFRVTVFVAKEGVSPEYLESLRDTLVGFLSVDEFNELVNRCKVSEERAETPALRED